MKVTTNGIEVDIGRKKTTWFKDGGHITYAPIIMRKGNKGKIDVGVYEDTHDWEGKDIKFYVSFPPINLIERAMETNGNYFNMDMGARFKSASELSARVENGLRYYD